MRIRHLLVRSLNLLRAGWNLTVSLEVCDRFQNVLGVVSLISDLVLQPAPLDAVPRGLDVGVRDQRLIVLFGQLRTDGESTFRLSQPETVVPAPL